MIIQPGSQSEFLVATPRRVSMAHGVPSGSVQRCPGTATIFRIRCGSKAQRGECHAVVIAVPRIFSSRDGISSEWLVFRGIAALCRRAPGIHMRILGPLSYFGSLPSANSRSHSSIRGQSNAQVPKSAMCR